VCSVCEPDGGRSCVPALLRSFDGAAACVPVPCKQNCFVVPPASVSAPMCLCYDNCVPALLPRSCLSASVNINSAPQPHSVSVSPPLHAAIMNVIANVGPVAISADAEVRGAAGCCTGVSFVRPLGDFAAQCSSPRVSTWLRYLEWQAGWPPTPSPSSCCVFLPTHSLPLVVSSCQALPFSLVVFS
jgi:hypothetical protein